MAIFEKEQLDEFGSILWKAKSVHLLVNLLPAKERNTEIFPTSIYQSILTNYEIDRIETLTKTYLNILDKIHHEELKRQCFKYFDCREYPYFIDDRHPEKIYKQLLNTPIDIGEEAWKLLISVPIVVNSQSLIEFVLCSSEPLSVPDILCILALVYKFKIQNSVEHGEQSNLTRPAEEVIQLRQPQIECLAWLGAGKTLHDISDITGMSYRTVRYHLDEARKKYGYSTMNQTLIRAAKDYDLSPLKPS